MAHKKKKKSHFTRGFFTYSSAIFQRLTLFFCPCPCLSKLLSLLFSRTHPWGRGRREEEEENKEKKKPKKEKKAESWRSRRERRVNMREVRADLCPTISRQSVKKHSGDVFVTILMRLLCDGVAVNGPTTRRPHKSLGPQTRRPARKKSTPTPFHPSFVFSGVVAAAFFSGYVFLSTYGFLFPLPPPFFFVSRLSGDLKDILRELFYLWDDDAGGATFLLLFFFLFFRSYFLSCLFFYFGGFIIRTPWRVRARVGRPP